MSDVSSKPAENLELEKPLSRRLILSRATRTAELEFAHSTLNEQSFAILELLAGHAPHAVDKATIAREIRLFSRVELDGAVRVQVSVLRVQLRASGFPEMIMHGPGRAYRLAAWIIPEVVDVAAKSGKAGDGIQAPCITSPRRGRGPLRRGMVGVGRGSLRDTQEDYLLGDPERLPSGIVLTGLGLVDFENRAVDFGSRRLNFATLRDFEFLAGVMRGNGAPVEEASLLKLGNYAPGEFGPQVLRRTSKRLNASLAKVDAPFRIEPCAKAYGSPYQAVPTTRE